MSLQTPVYAGNWKLNHGPAHTAAYLRDFLPLLAERHPGSVFIFPPAVSLSAAQAALAGRSDVLLGVQNIYWEEDGAYTGEISATLAREAGARVALVGHSERRHIFGESDDESARKVRAALAAGLMAILCLGETLEEREEGRAFEIVSRQFGAVAGGVNRTELDRFLVAYEPVWAIGTGRTASPADAAEMHRHIRSLLHDRFGSDAAALPILYGGSVKPDNAAELLDAPDVDGLLVGGASLEPASFAAICATPA